MGQTRQTCHCFVANLWPADVDVNYFGKIIDAQKVSQDALSAAEQAVRAAGDVMKTAEATTNLAYGTVGIAIVAIVVSVVMGLRRRKP